MVKVFSIGQFILLAQLEGHIACGRKGDFFFSQAKNIKHNTYFSLHFH